MPESMPAKAIRQTIRDPWQLDLPKEIVDHYEQSAKLTGIPSEQLLVATIKREFELRSHVAAPHLGQPASTRTKRRSPTNDSG